MTRRAKRPGSGDMRILTLHNISRLLLCLTGIGIIAAVYTLAAAYLLLIWL